MLIRLLTAVLVFAMAVFPSAAAHAELPQSRAQMKLSFAPVVKKVAPAVVNIYTKRVVAKRQASPFAGDPFFSQFFRNDLFGGQMRKQIESSLGSGVIVESGGLVITNAHVIKGGTEIKVVLQDGREFDADLALADEASDLALLRIDTKGEELPAVTLRPSETLEVGDLVLAIGNPFGVGQTVTSGIVSAKARSSLSINDFNFFIQTDAAINPGNSGGALVDLDGGVVGINSAIYSRDGGSLGIGFAIPSEMVASVIAAEKSGATNGSGVIRPWLGITAQNVTAEIAESLGLPRPSGVLVAELHPASPLKKAGVRQGDIVISMNGRELRTAAEMKFRMATVPLGRQAEVEILRGQKHYTFKVEAVVPPDEPPRELTMLKNAGYLTGVTIANINPAVAVELGLDEKESGVVVMETAQASRRIVRAGDVLLKINDREVSDVKSAIKAAKLALSSQGISLVLRRNGRVQQMIIR